ncbi:MAG: methyltransferase domain-containing protein [Deltaproteobacteria bacterium]|nr:methyltransferase domain-containing protein [Deltaproteobacteria bacterium]
MPQEQWVQRLVRYQYIESLLFDRRVLEIGCGSGRGADFLASRAAQVVGLDTSSVLLGRARGLYAHANVEFVVGEPDRLVLPDESFDVVLVPELERWITRGSLMPEIRRVLAREGVALFAVPSAESGYAHAMDYGDLVEFLSQAFANVRLLGEIPFAGTIVADYQPEDDELDPALDCTLVEEDEPPTHYLALCSDRPLRPLGYGLLQVPALATDRRQFEHLAEELDRTRQRLGQAEEAARRAQAHALRPPLPAGMRTQAEEVDAGARAELEAEVSRLREELAEAERRGLEASTESRQELTAVRRLLREKEDLAAQLGGELESARAALAELRTQVRQRPTAETAVSGSRASELGVLTRDAVPGQLQALQKWAESWEGRLERERQRAEALESRLEQERNRSDAERTRAQTAAESSLEARARAEAERARAEAAEHLVKEARALADQHRQRAEGAERRCDTLVGRIEQEAAELSRLHQRLAELQGMRQADQWRIDELTGRVKEAEARAGAGAPPRPFKQALTESDGAVATQVAVEAKSKAEARVAGLERDLERARAEAASARKELAAAEERLLEAQGALTKLTEELDGQAPKIAELEKNLMRSESRVVEASRRATNSESKIVQMEVRLKRSEAEAATLSKWAEQLREELKEAQGKSTVRPATPEPEVQALRNDLAEARTRAAELEGRCDRLLAEVEQAGAALREKERELSEARRASDGTLLEEVRRLRTQATRVEELEAEVKRLQRDGRNARQAEERLRDAEQAMAELRETKRELVELRERVRDVDGASEELEQLRLDAERHKRDVKELERLARELQAARAEVTRLEQAAARGGAAPVGRAPVEAEANELLRVRQHQLEALLEGAALHRDEAERLAARLAELNSLCDELKDEREELARQLEQCRRTSAAYQQQADGARRELTELGRELARTQGELKRYKGEPQPARS